MTRKTSRLAEGLHEKIESARKALSSASILLPAEKTQAIGKELRALDERLLGCRAYLTLAIAGGTGVGKSTLINALAGAEISPAGPVRPKTDLAVVFHHRDWEGELPWPAEFLAEPRRGHRIEGLSDLVILDLPDFDSVAAEHRVLAASILEDVDLVLWVVTPEKYADQALYDTLAASPQARENFVFVLNKIDKLNADSPDVLKGKTAELADDFVDRLAAAGVLSPRVFAFSARQALTSPARSEADGFQELNALLEGRRDDKEVRAILALNVEHEYDRTVGRLAGEVDTSSLSHKTTHLLKHIHDQWRKLEETIPGIARELLGSSGRDRIETILFRHSRCVGPVRALLTVGLHLRALLRGPGAESHSERPSLPEKPLAALTRRVTAMQDSVTTGLASTGWAGTAALTWSPAAQLRETVERESDTLWESISEVSGSPWRERVRLWKQRALLSLPLVGLVLYLADGQIARRFFETGELGLLYDMAVNLVFSPFTSKGLAALASAILLEGLATLFLAGRARRALRQEAEAMIEKARDAFARQLTRSIALHREEAESMLTRVQKAAKDLERILPSL